MMSDLIALKVSSQAEEEKAVTGIFLPNAAIGSEPLVPNSGLMLMMHEGDGVFSYSTAKSVVLPSQADAEEPYNRTMPIYIATTRVEVFEALFPTGIHFGVNDDDYNEEMIKHLGDEPQYFQIPKAVLQPVGLNRQKIIELCLRAPEIREYIERLETFQIDFGAQKIQVIIREADQGGLIGDLIVLDEKYYLPTPQRVRILIIAQDEQHQILNTWDILIATDNPKVLYQSFEGADIQEYDHVENTQRIKEQSGLPQKAKIFHIKGVSLQKGFITKSSYKKDTDEDRGRYIDDSLKSF